MAYSVQKTKWSQNNPTERVKTNEQAGRLRVAYATYEASAEQSTIEMFNLPNGARIVAGYLGHDALGSSTTLSVGYAAHTSSAGATVALDVDAGKLWISKNGTWNTVSGNAGNPATGANAVWSSNVTPTSGVTASGKGATLVPGYSVNDADTGFIFNFGQRAFKYTAPSGFKCLCTQNLDDIFSGAELNNPSKYFDIKTYTGTGADLDIKGLGFKPDLVWMKPRSAANDHVLVDAVRGVTKRLFSNLNNAESTAAESLKTFNSDGFTLGDHSSVNTSGVTHVAWNWDAGTAAVGSPGSSGDMTASVQWVNATAGFSISKVVKPDNTADQTFEHGLGAKPSVVLQRRYDVAEDWYWYTSEVDGSHDFLILNSDAAKSDTSTPAPTNSLATTMNAAGNYIVYCWTPIPGYSAFGIFDGSGSATAGPFQYCGFRPKMVIRKGITESGYWGIFDSARESIYNPVNQQIYLDGTSAEGNDASNWPMDFLSNGFNIRGANHQYTNKSGNKYIWMAFAEHPFKIARAN